MIKTYTLLICIMTFSTSVFARYVTGECSAKHQNIPLFLKVEVPDTRSLETFTGDLFYDGRQVATFKGTDEAKLSILFMSFSIRTSQGDYAEGKVTNLSKKQGLLKRLVIPAYGIDISQVPFSCHAE